jgi:hypothetical protein
MPGTSPGTTAERVRPGDGGFRISLCSRQALAPHPRRDLFWTTSLASISADPIVRKTRDHVMNGAQRFIHIALCSVPQMVLCLDVVPEVDRTNREGGPTQGVFPTLRRTQPSHQRNDVAESKLMQTSWQKPACTQAGIFSSDATDRSSVSRRQTPLPERNFRPLHYVPRMARS